MKTYFYVQLLLLLFVTLSACGEVQEVKQEPTDEVNQEPYYDSPDDELPMPYVTLPPNWEADTGETEAPEPPPRIPYDGYRFVYENAVRGVKLSMEIPADFRPDWFTWVSPIPMDGYWILRGKLFIGTIHPSQWNEFRDDLARCCAEQFWLQPEEPYREFVTEQGITIVEYRNTLLRTSYRTGEPLIMGEGGEEATDEYAAVLVFRSDGQNYREIGGVQILYSIFVVGREAEVFEERMEAVLEILNTLRFYDEPPLISQPITEIGQSLGLTQANFPRISGSTSTMPLFQEVVDAMIFHEHGVHRWHDTYYIHNVHRTVPSYELLIAGELDLILVPEPSRHVLQLAEQAGVELEFIPVAVEALVFITHSDNPIDGITTEQILDIYVDMTITNWSEIGGSDGHIFALNRNTHSGSQTLMDNLVLQGREVHPDLARYQLDAMRWVLEMAQVRMWPYFDHSTESWTDYAGYALGYTVFFYLNDRDFEEFNIKILAFDGIFPSHGTILSGEYPLTTYYFAVIRTDTPEYHPARRIANWLTPPVVQAAVEAARLGTLG